MNIVKTNEYFMIVDDFLEPDEHKKTWEYLNNAKYEFVHTKKWTSAFHMSEKQPLWGTPMLSHEYAQNTLYSVFPTLTPVDIFIKKILDNIKLFSRLVGEQGKDWAYFFLRPYIYTKDTGLRWHTDGKYKAAGALIYYAHPFWSPYWGGELLIDETIPSTEIPSCGDFDLARRSSFSSSKHDETIMEAGIGTYIIPKPNRLIILKGGPYHCIKKIDESAGDNIRLTLQGFFQDPSENLNKG